MEQDIYHIEFKKISELVDLSEMHVLEIGCGDGHTSSFLKRKAKSLICIDNDVESIKDAKLKLPDIDFRIGSGEKLEFEDDSFDIVFFTLSLHHQDWNKALPEAFRVTKSKGKIIIIEPAPDGELEELYFIFEDEKEKLEKVQETLKSGEYFVEKEDIFNSEWLFEDVEEVYRHFFNEFEMEKDMVLIKKMDIILKDKKKDVPLIIKDKINISVLSVR